MSAPAKPDPLATALGVDLTDTTQRLAGKLVETDMGLLRELGAERRRRGLSREEIAARLGWSVAVVAAFEAYDSDPTLSQLRRYALAVGVLVEHRVEAQPG